MRLSSVKTRISRYIVRPLHYSWFMTISKINKVIWESNYGEIKFLFKMDLRQVFHSTMIPAPENMGYNMWSKSNSESDSTVTQFQNHDDVIKWKHFPRYWPFVRGIHRGPVNSPHKGQWRGALRFSLICVWINGWVNNGEAGDLRRYRTHYDVTVMMIFSFPMASHQKDSENNCTKGSILSLATSNCIISAP